MDSILISIVMPAYNAEKTIAESIESVLKQTYQNIELIIVDDASDDRTVSIATVYAEKDPRVKILKNKKNAGVAATRNQGIAEAKGQYIALLDSDDLWEADKLERQIKLAIKEDAAIVYCSYDFINEEGKQIKKPFIVSASTDFNAMLSKSVISCSTAMIQSKLLKQHLFKSNFYHEDYALWMKLLSIPVHAVGDPKVLMHYRQVAGSRNENKLRSAYERWKIYRNYLQLSMRKSIVAFASYAINGLKKYGWW